MGRNIKAEKAGIREKYKQLRSEIPPVKKEKDDRAILNRLIGLEQYRNCRLLLTYVSTQREVDTYGLIQHALEEGKVVAVPVCNTRDYTIDFYRLVSLDDLRPASYSLMEPDPDKSEKITDFQDAVCIVPGFVFDMDGYRLGYGKGYYDRFLGNFHGSVVGVCYSSFLHNLLPHGYYDRPVDLLVTDKFVKNFSNGKR